MKKCTMLLAIGIMAVGLAACGGNVSGDVSTESSKVESQKQEDSKANQEAGSEEKDIKTEETKAEEKKFDEPLDLTQTAIRNVYCTEQKDAWGYAIDCELPIYVDVKEKYEDNGRNYFRASNKKEYCTVWSEFGKYNPNTSLDEKIDSCKQSFPNSAFNDEVFYNDDKTKAVVCYEFDGEDHDRYINAVYVIFDGQNEAVMKINLYVNIDVSLYEEGMRIRESSAVTYEKILRDAVKAYIK